VAVRRLLGFYGEEVKSITITGHSLGGALAQLCAFDLVGSGVNHQGDSISGPLIPVTAITFEAPRAGGVNPEPKSKFKNLT
jgi:putative lipase involved disintegration of autophagic bodies